jgi:hypothetical protein
VRAPIAAHIPQILICDTPTSMRGGAGSGMHYDKKATECALPEIPGCVRRSPEEIRAVNLPPGPFDPENVPRHVVSVAIRALLRCGHAIDKNEARYVVAAVLEADRRAKAKPAPKTRPRSRPPARRQQPRPVKAASSLNAPAVISCFPFSSIPAPPSRGFAH